MANSFRSLHHCFFNKILKNVSKFTRFVKYSKKAKENLPCGRLQVTSKYLSVYLSLPLSCPLFVQSEVIGELTYKAFWTVLNRMIMTGSTLLRYTTCARVISRHISFFFNSTRQLFSTLFNSVKDILVQGWLLPYEQQYTGHWATDIAFYGHTKLLTLSELLILMRIHYLRFTRAMFISHILISRITTCTLSMTSPGQYWHFQQIHPRHKAKLTSQYFPGGEKISGRWRNDRRQRLHDEQLPP